MAHPISVVDAFTDVPFRGNPAGVCVLAQATTDEWMGAVAAELNLAETAFVVPRPDGDHDLRWFTPTTEVDLCGHATLASAHVLGGEGRFHTRSGVLTCRRAGDGAITMDFPALPVEPVPDPPDWTGPLGLPAGSVVAVAQAPFWTLVEADSAARVRAARPDRNAVLALAPSTAVLLAASPGDRPGIDSVCRVFAPGVGIDEDPVTGSAHCVLGPWLAARTGRTKLVGEQVSARSGVVGMRVDGDRVELSGHAVTVVEGLIHSDPPPA